MNSSFEGLLPIIIVIICIFIIFVSMPYWFNMLSNNSESFNNSNYPSNIPFYNNLYNITLNNTDYRKVIDTVGSQQIVLMSLLPGQSTGDQIYTNTQFIRNVKGDGMVTINGQDYKLPQNGVVKVSADSMHSIKNVSSSQRLQLNVIFTNTQFP
jgi:quercetin dioxygenase-like cupin family protein